MSDAARPSDDKFSQVLKDSLDTWSCYVNIQSEDHLLPRHAIDLGPLISQTPPFLGGGLACLDKTTSFACEEKPSTQSQGSLVINGRSTWRTSDGSCDTESIVIPKQLLLAVGGRLDVRLSDDSPFSDWPGVQGLPSYDQGNYLSVLFFAWAYILSARWVELLGCSADHECSMVLNTLGAETLPKSDKQPVFEIDIGNDACEEEIFWWRTILCSGDGWDATTKYKGHIYLSPWSVSAKDVGFTLATNSSGTKSKLPESGTALKYLSRFCMHHRLYAQCSVALAGVLYIPFLRKRTLSLPLPKQNSPFKGKNFASDSLPSIPDLLNNHSEIIPKYMTLSLNTWGLRSLLNSTFFNADIECNLVSAWLNPAFAIISSILQSKTLLATFMANRQPRLGILWLGAILTSQADSILRDVRAGMTALDLPASAWAGIAQTFLTSAMESTHGGESIRRDDECRLLFITACEGHERPPVWPWKPFGSTQLGDTELSVRQHARCSCHCLKYECWEWILTNNSSIQCSEAAKSQPPIQVSSPPSANKTLAGLNDFNYDFYAQALSEGATRGIFEWLRSTGYPCSERPIYQHSWFDLEGTDKEEEPDDTDSDLEVQRDPKDMHVEGWLENIE